MNGRTMVATTMMLVAATAQAGASGILQLDSGAGGYPMTLDAAKFKLVGGDGSLVKWINDAENPYVYRAERLNCRFSSGTYEMYGVELVPSWSVSFEIGSSVRINLGAGGFAYGYASGNRAPDIKGTGTIALTASQTWSCTNVAAWRASLSLDSVKFLLADGITWTVAGEQKVTVPQAIPAANAEQVVVTSPAELSLSSGGSLNAKKVVVTGASAKLTDGSTVVPGESEYVIAKTIDLADGAELSVGGDSMLQAETINVLSGDCRLTGFFNLAALQAIDIAEGATLTVDCAGNFPQSLSGSIRLTGAGDLVVAGGYAQLGAVDAGFSGTISVTGGDLQLESTEVLPDGVTISTSGNGGVLLLSVTGDEDERISGNWAQAIGDEAYAGEELVVRPGRTLYVQGDGLTANTRLVMDGGSLVFQKSANVAASVHVKTNTTISASGDSIRGVFSGFFDATNAYTATFVENKTTIMNCYVVGRGEVWFTGGGRADICKLLASQGSDGSYGAIIIASNDFHSCRADIGVIHGRLFGVRDGATLFCDWARQGGVFWLNARGPSDSSFRGVVEIVNGGTIVDGSNRGIYLGYGGEHGKLLIDGGTYRNNGGREILVYGNSNEIEFRSGLVLYGNALGYNTSWHMLTFNWYGGTWQVGSMFGDKTSLSDGFDGVFTMASQMTMNICGPDCVLDLGGHDALKLVNENNDSTSSVSKKYKTAPKFNGVGDDARLTVTNGTRFLANFFPATNCALRVALSEASVVGTVDYVTRPDVTAMKAVELAWSNATASADHAVEVTNLVVGAGAVWPRANVGGNVTYLNLGFEDDAVLASETTDGVTVVPGVLTLPERLTTAIADPAGEKELVRAAAVEGTVTTVDRKPGTRRRNLELRGTSLWGWSNGLMLLLR